MGGTLTAMLRQLGTALKLPATRNRLELSMAIHDRLKGTDKVIIIDEAQNLRFDALEELRSLRRPRRPDRRKRNGHLPDRQQ